MKNTQIKKKPVVNPFEAMDSSNSTPKRIETSDSPSIFKDIPVVGNNATKIDFDSLNNAYAGQDKQSLANIKQSLNPEQQKQQADLQFFKKYKREEEEYYQKRKQEEEEKKQQEELAEQQRKKQEEEERLARNAKAATPQGKKKKSIFGKIREKASAILPPEMKPGGGKQ